jgi:hypothetical protein
MGAQGYSRGLGANALPKSMLDTTVAKFLNLAKTWLELLALRQFACQAPWS